MKKKKQNKLPKNRNKQSRQPTGKLKKNKYFDLLRLAIIILLGIIIYSNSFDCTFQFDDKPNIVNNEIIKDVSDVKAIWNYSQTRFIPIYSFALNYHFDELNVGGYHLVNLIIHLINACLVYWLTFLIFSSPVLREYPIAKHKTTIAFVTGMLFVSTPLATQSVTYLVQRMASMSAMFYLLSLALYVKGRLSENKYLPKYLLFASAFIFALLALLSKENAFTLPFAIILFEIFFLQTKKLNINFKDYRVILSLAGLLGFILLVLFKFSFNILEPHLPVSQNDFRTITSFNYLLTQFGVIVKYIQLLILPINLNLDYNWPLANHFFEIRTLVSFLLLVSLILLAITQFKKKRILSFGIFWFLLTLSIESSIIPIDDLIFEHRTYLPSFGFFLIFASGISVLLWDKYKILAIGFFTMIILSNSYLTYQRNQVWQNEFTLWSDVIKKSPDKVRGYNNRGYVLTESKKYKAALSDFNHAIKLNPNHAKSFNNRGRVFFHEKKMEQALSDYNKAIELQPDFAEPYYNRGIILGNEKINDEAIRDYSQAIELNPNYIEAFVNRGNLFRSEARYDKAMSDYKKAMELNSDFAKIYYNRGILFMMKKKFAVAINDFSKVIALNTDDVIRAYYNRGMAKHFSGKKDDNGCMDLQEAARLGNQAAADFYSINCH